MGVRDLWDWTPNRAKVVSEIRQNAMKWQEQRTEKIALKKRRPRVNGRIENGNGGTAEIKSNIAERGRHELGRRKR